MVIRKPKHDRQKTQNKRTRELSSAERIAALGATIPPEELARHPKDFAQNFHHYMHGHPKQDPD